MYLKNPHVTLNGTDISALVQGVTLNIGREDLDDTVGGTDTRSTAKGLVTWSGEIVMKQDFADNAVDEDLWDIHNAGVAVAIAIRPTTAVVGAANPSYSGNVVLGDYSPLSGAVGTFQAATIPFMAAGALSRAIA